MKLENKVAKAVRIAGWIICVLGILGGIDVGTIYAEAFSTDSEFSVIAFVMCIIFSVVLCIVFYGFSELIEQSYQNRLKQEQCYEVLQRIDNSLSKGPKD